MSIAEIAKKGVAYVAKNPREVEKYFNSVAGVLGAAAILIDRAKNCIKLMAKDMSSQKK